MIKPRIKVIGPTPDISPGTPGGFSSTPAIASRTPIRLRVTDDVEQPVMFFLAWKSSASITIDGLRILDAAMRKRLFERGPTRVVLSGHLVDIAAVAAAIKADYPNMIVLRYANAQRIPETPGHPASTMFQHFYVNRETLLLQKINDSPDDSSWIIGSEPNRELRTDITLAATRSYIAQHLADQIAEHGVDGVLIDSMHTLATTTPNAIVGGAQKNADWPAAVQALVQEIRAKFDAEFPSAYKELWFNGLWAHQRTAIVGTEQIDRQAALLPYADGATVEFFGRSGLLATATYYPPPDKMYETQVGIIAPKVTAVPTKPILVRGSVTDAYYDYGPDLQNARYDFACYLCTAWTPETSFIFRHIFNINRLPKHRALGFAVYSYQDLPLGVPVCGSVDDGSAGLWREFEGGWVFLAPDASGLHVWTLPRGLYTARGQLLPLGTRVSLTEGDALILLKDRPPPAPYRMRADLTESNEEWILETVTGEHRYQRLRARIRSADPASALAVRIQTDEVNKPFLQLVLLPTGGANPLSAGKDYAYGLDAYLGATHKVVADAYVADDEWYDVDLDLAEACAPLPTYQVMSARAFGDLELERLVVYDPEWLIPEFDTAAPVAFFSAVADELEVAFIDESAPALGTTITAWLWDFGDGMTSTDQNPTHVYSLTGGKSVTLTVTGSNGRQATYSSPIKVAINADGPLGVSMPVTQSGFTATGLMPPRHSWRGDIASGNLVDSIGSMTLTASLITAYQQSTGIAEWTRTGVRFTETNSQRIRTTSGPDASTVETLLVMVVFLQTPNAVRNIASLGSNIDVRHLSSGKLRVTNGTAGNANQADGTAVYDGDVYLIGLHNDPIRDIGEYETNINTPAAVRAPAYVDPTGTTMGFGDIVGADSFKGILLHAWLWKAQPLSVNVSTDDLTIDSHGLGTSAGPVRVYNVGGALPDGLGAGTDYYVIRTGANTFKLAATAEDAENSVAIDVTGVGTGAHYLRAIPSFQTIAQRLGWVDTPE